MNTAVEQLFLDNASSRHLDWLESEAIHIMREVAAECSNPALLFSGGKDSVVLLRIAEKAFRPGKFPFPLVHIDTGHNFPEVISFRDQRAAELGEKLVVRSVEDSIKRGTVRLRNPLTDSRNAAQAVTLLETIEEFKFDACIGGARRDEEKPAPRNVFFPSATSSANGIRRHNVLNYGICTTHVSIRAKTCACSRSPTGPSSTSGNTSPAKNWRCRQSTLRMSAR